MEKGYKIKVIEDKNPIIYCVDSRKNIRGFYQEEFKQYISDYSLWKGKRGKLFGKLKKGNKILLFTVSKNLEGEILNVKIINSEDDLEKLKNIKQQKESYYKKIKKVFTNTKLKSLEILSIEEINVNEMLKDKYIAGFDRPILRTEAMN